MDDAEKMVVELVGREQELHAEIARLQAALESEQRSTALAWEQQSKTVDRLKEEYERRKAAEIRVEVLEGAIGRALIALDLGGGVRSPYQNLLTETALRDALTAASGERDT